MSVLFTTQRLTRTANLPDDAACTVCGWATQQTLHSGATSQVLIALQAAGTGLFLGDDGATTNLVLVQNGGATLNVGPAFAAGREFFWAFTSSGLGIGATHVYCMPRGSNSLTATDSAGTRTAFAPSSLDVGDDSFSHPWKGRIWNVMAWNRLLTPAELLRQAFLNRPIYPDVNIWYPLARADDLFDHGPNRRDPTVTGTPTTFDAFIPPRRRLRVLTGTSADVALALTGQALATALGTLIPAKAITLTGQVLAGALGTFAPATAKALTGSVVASALGTLVPTLTLALTGLSVSIVQGNVSAGGDLILALTGQLLTSAQGTVAPGAAVALSGSALASSQGTVIPSNSKAVTGSALTSTLGTLVPARVLSLTGLSVSIGQGNVTAPGNVTVALTGVLIASSQGTVVAASSKTLSGSALAASLGAIGPAMTVAMTGSVITASQGVVFNPTAIAPDIDRTRLLAVTVRIETALRVQAPETTTLAVRPNKNTIH